MEDESAVCVSGGLGARGQIYQGDGCSAKGFTFSKKIAFLLPKTKAKSLQFFRKKVKEKSKSIAVLFSIADTDVLL